VLNWLFKKRPAVPAPAAAPAVSPSASAPSARNTPAATPRKPPAPVVDWAARLHAAQGDDAALLALAQAGAPLDVKTAAVAAIHGEATLRQAELALRERDRKVHRLAKQRLSAAVTQRESRAQAVLLLQRAEVLAADEQLPINHLVELDRAWSALPQDLLEAAQRTQFADVRERLDADLRQREAVRQALARWLADAAALQAQAHPALAREAAEGTAADAQALLDALHALVARRPDVAATAAAGQALHALAAQAAALLPHLAWFDLPGDAGAAPVAPDLPEPADPALAQALAQRRQALQAPAPAAPQPAPEPVAPPPPRPPRLAPEQRERAAELLQQGEAALAEGRVSDLQRHLQAIDGTLGTQDLGALPEALRARLHALRAEASRLKAWQQWGGSRAREDLVHEAESLAALTLAALPPAAAAAQEAPDLPAPMDVASTDTTGTDTTGTDTSGSDTVSMVAPDADTATDAPVADAPVTGAAATETPPENTSDAWADVMHVAMPDDAPPGAALRTRTRTPRPPAPPRVKLDLQAHAEQIRQLRARWKELDRLGAQAGLPLWQRFDGALNLAYGPIAAQQAAVKAARQDNLAQRQALLDALEGLPEPLPSDDGVAPDWRGLGIELDRFQQAWRKLGPAEHTVPAGARKPLDQRLQAAVARLETPLQQARAEATRQREAFIAQAEALSPGAGAWDLPRRVRELQQQWQDHARALPLQRGVETALWTRFKAATDAVFAHRDAEVSARDAERAEALAEREALLARLESLDDTQPGTAIERALQEVDAGWRQAGEVPRAAQPALERRLQAAHRRAVALLDGARLADWRASCDALVAMAGTDDAPAPASMPASGVVPAAWMQAVARRHEPGAASRALPPTGVDDLLLQLEAALHVPVAPPLLEARRLHKLQALKQALEGRASPQPPRSPSAAFTTLLAQPALQPEQRDRLLRIVQALRGSTPGTLA